MEPIKQEIVSCIYENGEQLITGPVLQEVLVDMVDDYNEKISSGSLPSDLIEKTGSWDSASAWVEDNKDDLVHTGDLDGYATEEWVGEQGYLTEHQDISGLATTESVNQLSESVAESIADIPVVDLSGYATTSSVNEATESVKEWVEAKHYLTSASLSGSVTEETVGFMIGDATASVKEWVEEKNYATEAFVSESIAGIDIPDVSGYLPTASFNPVSASFDERINAITGSDLSGYATTESLNLVSQSISQSINGLADTVNGKAEARDLTSLSESVANDFANLDISGLATTESLNQVSSSLSASIAAITGSDLSGYATTESVNQLSSSVATDIQNARTEASQAITGLGTIIQGESDRVTGLSASFDDRINNITGSSVDLSGYATTASVNQLSSSVSSDILNARTEASAGFASVDQGIRGLSASFDQRINDITVDLSGYLTTASFNQVSESIDERLSNHQEAIEALEYAGTLYWDEDHWSAFDKLNRQEFDEVSASFDQRIDAIVPPDLSTYATTASLNQVSESLSQSIAAITASGADTELRNFLFGTGTQDITSITSSIANIGATISSNSTLGFNTVPENGKSIGITIYNTSANSASIILPETVEVDNVTYNLINNGVDGSGSMTIPAGEYGDIVVTREDTNLFVRTSIDISNIDVDLSGYATTASLNSVSQSLSASIAASSTDLSVLSGTNWSDNPVGQFVGNFGYVYWDEMDQEWQTSLNTEALSTIGGIGLWDDMNQEWRAAASSESLYNLSESVSNSLANISSSGDPNPIWERSSLSPSAAIQRNLNNAILGSNADGALAQGVSCSVAGGTGAHAEGLRTTAEGGGSHAEGIGTTIVGGGIGSASHAEGYYTFVGWNSQGIEASAAHAEGTYTTASGTSAHSEGEGTKAFGLGSHAEGHNTRTLANYSHAEGDSTSAEGEYSHAEGWHTSTSNPAELAVGKYNFTSSGQIFSVGDGRELGGNQIRRNAVSVVAVSSSASSSVFIQGIGGYDGTNPQPGVNDLATAISLISGSGLTAETWTFVLEDSSSITKNVVVL